MVEMIREMFRVHFAGMVVVRGRGVMRNCFQLRVRIAANIFPFATRPHHHQTCPNSMQKTLFMLHPIEKTARANNK